MPAREVMKDFRQGTLHSGKGGPIVKNPHQAKAILLSYLRKEGYDIPQKHSGFQSVMKAKKHGRK